jgi:hypothetical protein
VSFCDILRGVNGGEDVAPVRIQVNKEKNTAISTTPSKTNSALTPILRQY